MNFLSPEIQAFLENNAFSTGSAYFGFPNPKDTDWVCPRDPFIKRAEEQNWEIDWSFRKPKNSEYQNEDLENPDNGPLFENVKFELKRRGGKTEIHDVILVGPRELEVWRQATEAFKSLLDGEFGGETLKEFRNKPHRILVFEDLKKVFRNALIGAGVK